MKLSVLPGYGLTVSIRYSARDDLRYEEIAFIAEMVAKKHPPQTSIPPPKVDHLLLQ